MTRKPVLIGIIVAIGLSIVGILFFFKPTSTQSSILIDTNPQATVYINDSKAGNTPYQARMQAGDVTVKIVPNNGGQSWATKLTLIAGIETVVKRDFGVDDAHSSGEVLAYEKSLDDKASLTIVSVPDKAQVSVDGDIKGITPLPLDSLPEGDHSIVISHIGFKSSEISAKTHNGYKLTIVSSLAQDDSALYDQQSNQATQSAEVVNPVQQSATPSATPNEYLGKVEILQTDLGYLRVRSDATSSSQEIGQVHQGETYDILDQKGGWYQIEYQKGFKGWVSAQYCKKI